MTTPETTTCSPSVAAVKPLLIVLEDAPTLEAIAAGACLRVALQEIVINRLVLLLGNLLDDPTHAARTEARAMLEDLKA